MPRLTVVVLVIVALAVGAGAHAMLDDDPRHQAASSAASANGQYAPLTCRDLVTTRTLDGSSLRGGTMRCFGLPHRLVPAGADTRVFPLDQKTYLVSFFLGDVCGKGPDAAAVTSLARYTMRTAAMLRETPDAILIDLNAALLMESAESMQTCTVVYGQLDMGDAAAAITLAVAGHPPPLVVRAGGVVESTPAHGTMLGAVTDPAFAICQVSLEPGDAIVICSDGILDTEIDGDRVDEQRVSELLCGPQLASAQMLVDRLLHALRSSLRPMRDDIAIMALRRTPL